MQTEVILVVFKDGEPKASTYYMNMQSEHRHNQNAFSEFSGLNIFLKLLLFYTVCSFTFTDTQKQTNKKKYCSFTTLLL